MSFTPGEKAKAQQGLSLPHTDQHRSAPPRGSLSTTGGASLKPLNPELGRDEQRAPSPPVVDLLRAAPGPGHARPRELGTAPLPGPAAAPLVPPRSHGGRLRDLLSSLGLPADVPIAHVRQGTHPCELRVYPGGAGYYPLRAGAKVAEALALYAAEGADARPEYYTDRQTGAVCAHTELLQRILPGPALPDPVRHLPGPEGQ